MLILMELQKKSNSELLEVVNNNFDLRPGMIANELQLWNPVYLDSACYGHFGREEFTWEKTKNS